jgi:hypothetical protein
MQKLSHLFFAWNDGQAYVNADVNSQSRDVILRIKCLLRLSDLYQIFSSFCRKTPHVL